MYLYGNKLIRSWVARSTFYGGHDALIRLGCTFSSLAALATLAMTSCDTSFVNPDPLAGLHRVYFDSVSAASTPYQGDTLHLRFWGVAGPNCCYSFLGLQAARDSFRLDVEGWSYESQTAQTCCAAVKYFRGEPLDVFPVYTGDFTIAMHHPNETVLLDTIQVLSRFSEELKEP
jgi:hypothetical protein